MSGRKRAHSKAGKPPVVSKITPANLDSRTLILAPTANDARLTWNFLTEAGLFAQVCGDVAQLCHEFNRGCGALILAEETLGQSSISLLIQTLAGQPAWSDVPVILITSGGEASQTQLRRVAVFGPGGNVTLLERPFRPDTLISVVEVSLRSRQRQYESHQLMKELSLARAHIEAALGIADVGTWTWDIKTDRVYADKNTARIFSMSAEDAAGGPSEKYFLRIHPGDRAAVEASKKAAMQSESGEYEMDFRLQQPDGAMRRVTSRGRMEKNENGAPERFLGVVIDITEQRRHAEASDRLAAIVESSEDAIISEDLNGIIVTWNRGAESLFGYSVQEAVGQPITILMPSDRLNEELDILERIRRGERIEHYETIRKRKDGKLLEISLTVSPLKNGEGKVIGASKIARDVTKQKQAERDLAQAHQVAVAASRAKDDFLAALSHELRTPLNPALLLASESADNHQLPEDVRLIFETIRKNIELEALLVDDLLDLTRITNGKMVVNKSPVDIHDVLRDAIATTQAEQQEKKLHLDIKLNAPQSLVEGDALRLQQVFWNVLKNAVKFTPANGKITLETSITQDGRLLIEITDTGIGMNAAELARVFTAFVQGDHAGSSGSHRFGGLGLGLAISRHLVELHSGKITARSSGKDRGSAFAIELPLSQEIKAISETKNGHVNHNPSELSKAAARVMAVLLVEDHEITRTVLAQLLARRNYRVVAVDSMSKARAAASQNRFDLLISDIGLPDGNGNDLMSEFREKYGMTGIALTGYGMEEDVARGKAAGFVTHLVKPVRIQSLESALAFVRNML